MSDYIRVPDSALPVGMTAAPNQTAAAHNVARPDEDAWHDESCCMAGFNASDGPHPDCRGAAVLRAEILRSLPGSPPSSGEAPF